MRNPKIGMTVVICLAAVIALTACGNSTPKTLPTPATSSTAPAWQAKFTADQIVDYNQALQAYDRIQANEAPIWTNPTSYTPAQAQTIFDGDWSTPSIPMFRYNQAIQYKLVQFGTAKVIDSELIDAIEPTSQSPFETLVIRQCVDGSGTGATQNGAPVPTKPGSTPRGFRELHLVKLENKFLLASDIGGTGAC